MLKTPETPLNIAIVKQKILVARNFRLL